MIALSQFEVADKKITMYKTHRHLHEMDKAIESRLRVDHGAPASADWFSLYNRTRRVLHVMIGRQLDSYISNQQTKFDGSAVVSPEDLE